MQPPLRPGQAHNVQLAVPCRVPLDEQGRKEGIPDQYRIMARSQLYRNQILQENMRWKALADIYTMHSFAPVSYAQQFFV